MMTETQNPQKNKIETVTVEGRSRFTMNRVLGVGSFDEESVTLLTDAGKVYLDGENLKIENLSKASGEILITGDVGQITFAGENEKKTGAFRKKNK